MASLPELNSVWMQTIEKVILVLDRATPQQQEAIFQKIRATPETRHQLLTKVQMLRQQRQQRMMSAAAGRRLDTKPQNNERLCRLNCYLFGSRS